MNVEKELKDFLKLLIDHIFRDRFWEIIRYMNTIEKKIEKKEIDLLMLDADAHAFEKVFAQLCRKHNIPSAVVVHGVMSSETAAFVPLSADYIFVYGESQKKNLINSGIDRKRIVITGSPELDEFIKKDEKQNGKTILYLMGSGNTDILIPNFFMTKKENKNMLREVMGVMKKFPEYKLIIKGRYGFDMNILPEIIAKEENFINFEFVESVENEADFLSKPEAILMENTGMGLKALILNKPVISISLKHLEYNSIYSKSKAIPKVYNDKQLEKQIKMAIKKGADKKEIKKFLKQEIFNAGDGKASRRIADFIECLLGKR